MNEFKTALATALDIVKWSPTEAQLRTIAIRLAASKAQTKSEVRAIVAEVYPNATSVALEGVDHSDLRALLMLATQVAKG